MPRMPDLQEEEREETPDPEEHIPWDIEHSLPQDVSDGFCEALVLALVCIILGIWIQGVIAGFTGKASDTGLVGVISQES